MQGIVLWVAGPLRLSLCHAHAGVHAAGMKPRNLSQLLCRGNRMGAQSRAAQEGQAEPQAQQAAQQAR